MDFRRTNQPRRAWKAWLLVGLCGMGASLAAHAVDPATLASQGANGVAPCASCHGANGAGLGSFPRLAGMDAGYLARQLDNFADGTRGNPVMQPVAKALAPQDRAAIAAYYAALPIPASLTAAPTAPADDRTLGARLAREGAWHKGVPACTQCHAPGGIGVGSAFPQIAGQPAAYLRAQLEAWKAGTRRNDPMQLMKSVSQKLTADEVAAVSEWFARQPARKAVAP